MRDASHVKEETNKNTIENQLAFNNVIREILNQLATLSFDSREIIIESLSTLFLRGLVPMSGMTVQQFIEADPDLLKQLNDSMQKPTYKNGSDPRYVYQFAREATSAGIVPVYTDKTTGELYIALICNKRNTKMYNWSAGYTEAPLPGWRGNLLSSTDPIYYDRNKIKNSATKTMEKILNAADGDWTKTNFDHKQFAEEFKVENVILPKIDLNSLHTAIRECKEEINLDIDQFPERKIFLIPPDNTVGLSQGDAPGQTSNRSHQYMVYLGKLDKQPEIKPGDDVAIADWIKVSNILRKSAVDYSANNKPLCVYMLRGLEMGLKDIWDYLLAQASTQISRYSNKPIVRFSKPENIAAYIENFCIEHEIEIKESVVELFLKNLSDEFSFKTRTGNHAQIFLNCLLETAKYLTGLKLNPENFMSDITKILLPIEPMQKLYSPVANISYFRPVHTTTNITSEHNVKIVPPVVEEPKPMNQFQ